MCGPRGWLYGAPEERPRDIFKQHVRVAPYPEDDSEAVVRLLGADGVIAGSDYPTPRGSRTDSARAQADRPRRCRRAQGHAQQRSVTRWYHRLIHGGRRSAGGCSPTCLPVVIPGPLRCVHGHRGQGGGLTRRWLATPPPAGESYAPRSLVEIVQSHFRYCLDPTNGDACAWVSGHQPGDDSRRRRRYNPPCQGLGECD